ncbi:hypothetical protein K1T71_010716 [Dendrolimus kikuchii]|uniref:Uncharacterized protein n=1 Tax=Dendrolimus kikuchii TaxID=765133 RepID=A0ACC1CPZ0_9NEOP|nr:hypothetical protein K1T71_010716 [Dendrolimus kikuchii]
MSNVKLAIRVRPFSEREVKSESDRVRVVNVIDDHYVTITNIKVSLSGAGDSRERVRRYHADYTFDSACSPNQPTYATQEKLFETIGSEVLTSVSQGFSTCVLAYGQSATGKTHTMMGTDTQPGLIPRICKALAEEHPCEITISFLEIYNERVHDLLVGDTATPTFHSLPRRRGNSRKDLRVREHPAKGPYVQNLRRVAVNNVEALLALVTEGTRRRRTAATRRNSTSSRSHALLEIATSRATLHLADLAGSEKAGWEGSGGRQKEGANINKSLVALSNVISALVTGGNGRGRFVPYRDSALTWLLKDSFTGGATTFIIATVSPSFVCYGESASTLRWAARARQLRTSKTTCGVNLTPRAILQAQYDQLICELGRNFIQYLPETGKLLFDDQHWELCSNNLDRKNGNELITTAIGNNMNQPRLKVDANLGTTPVASGSLNVANVMDNTKITNAINEEVDKLFGSALERTSSGSNLKVIAPLRHKKRQYRSQEVLPPDEKIATSQSQSSITSPSQSETQLNIAQSEKSKISHVAILHENQRAEIIASVTERLYSKLKKKEEAAVSKIESVVDKKIMEPLSELRICTNARQRLIELSQKAIRNKRKIGIPAYTQTRISVIRVKDQATDVQTDLGSYILEKPRVYSLHRDVGTETMPMTPRCKEIAVGSKYDLINFIEMSTGTQTRHVPCKTSFVMTDNPTKCNQFTQTQVIPPPRRKKRAPIFPSNLECSRNNLSPESISAPVISINVSQTYSIDSDSHSSDDSVEIHANSVKPDNITITPDLLTNHSTSDSKIEDENNEKMNISYNGLENEQVFHIIKEPINEIQKGSGEFSDQEEHQLPRVTVDTSIPRNNSEMRNMILGRNKDMYPYNIVLSPMKEKANVKRIVKFKDFDTENTMNISSESSWDWDDGFSHKESTLMMHEKIEPERKYIETLGSIYSDSSDSSKTEIDAFACRKGRYVQTMNCLRKKRVPIYKSNPRYNTASSRFYREQADSGKWEYDSSNEIHHTDDINSAILGKGDKRNSPIKIQSNTISSKVRESDVDFDICDQNINISCIDLEKSTQKYDKYLQNYLNKSANINRLKEHDKRPKDFLQELVQLRREVIKSSGDNTDSSVGLVHRKVDRN